MKNLMSFFTRIPIRGNIEKVPNEISLLPVLSLITAAIPAIILYLNIPMAFLIAVIVLYLVTGTLHLDGLADFSDGVMVKGDRDRKIKAMKDLNVGIAGTTSVILILLVEVFSLRYLPFYGIILGELNSKYSMLLAIKVKKPLGKGLGFYFMNNVSRGQLILGTVLYSAILAFFSVFSIYSLFSTLGLVFSAYTIWIAIKNFGGLNGDCIGAVGEITRAGTLLVLVFAWWYL